MIKLGQKKISEYSWERCCYQTSEIYKKILNENNFISILITNYNKSKFLKKSILSVKNQKYNNYEIIIFDDNSDDNSLEIIKKFKKLN